MANKNRNLIIAYFDSKSKAKRAAKELKRRDKTRGDMKLGGIGIITADNEGNLKTRKVGRHAAGTGAKWGFILGAAVGILSGGITLIGGAIAGLAGGAVTGALFHKRIGMSDDDRARLIQHLKIGGAALAVMADDYEVDLAKFELKSLGGEVESYNLPGEAVAELEAATVGKAVEKQKQVIVVDETERNAGDANVVAAAIAAVETTKIDDVDETEAAAEVVSVGEIINDEGESAALDEAAPVTAVAAAGTAEEESTEPAPPAILHYRRYDDDYAGVGLHVWTGYEDEVDWDNPLPPSGKDDYGIYFRVPIAEGSTGLAYIIHRGDEKDLWDDQYLDFERHGREVWIVQNMPGYIPRPN